MRAITLGIIGCGRVTQQIHFRALRSVSAIRVVAVNDIDPVIAKKVGDLFGAKVHQTAEELISDRDVEAIAICTTPDTHCHLTLRVLAAGKHVFVEKPLAMSVDDATSMQNAADVSGTVAAVGFNVRFHRLIERAQRQITSGRLGDVLQVITTWSAPIVPSSIGVSMDIGIHHIDACSFLLQDFATQATIVCPANNWSENSAVLTLRMSKGALVSSAFSYGGAAVNEFRIIGTAGSLRFSLYDAGGFVFSSAHCPEHGMKSRLRKLINFGRLPLLMPAILGGGEYTLSYRREWEAFVDAVRGKRTPLATFADGVAAVKLLQDAKRNGN